MRGEARKGSGVGAAAWTWGLCVAALVGGCASSREMSVQVRSYGTWPEARTPGTYAFDRLPSQQSTPDLQARLEAAAAPALAAAGFKPGPRARAQVWVQVTAQMIQTREETWASPPPMAWSLRQDYWAWRHGWDMGLGTEYRPAQFEQRVALLVRDRVSGEVLHEAHGMVGGSRMGEAQWRPMFEALLKDFPGPAISPRTVVVPREPGLAEPAPGASSPAAGSSPA